jgi:hypothetical protein
MSKYVTIIHSELKYNFINYLVILSLKKVIFVNVSYNCSKSFSNKEYFLQDNIYFYYLSEDKIDKDNVRINALIGFVVKSKTDKTKMKVAQEFQTFLSKNVELIEVKVLPLHENIDVITFFEKLVSNRRYNTHRVSLYRNKLLKRNRLFIEHESTIVALIEWWNLNFIEIPQ